MESMIRRIILLMDEMKTQQKPIKGTSTYSTIKSLMNNYRLNNYNVDKTGFLKLHSRLDVSKSIVDEGSKILNILERFQTKIDLELETIEDPNLLQMEIQLDRWVKELTESQKALLVRLEQIAALKELEILELRLLNIQVGSETWEEETEKVKKFLEEYKKSLQRFRNLSDNMGTPQSRTDCTVKKGKVYGIGQRTAFIFVENPSVEKKVEEFKLSLGLRTPVESVTLEATITMRMIKRCISEAENCILVENQSSYRCKRLANKLERLIDKAMEEISSSDPGESDLIDDAEEVLMALQKKISEEEEKRDFAKNFQRVSPPKWNGDPKTYHSWLKVQKTLNKNPDENLRVIHLKNSITSSEVLMMLQHVKSMAEAEKILDSRYGDTRIFIPRIFSTIENLESPRTREAESENINIILNAMLELTEYLALEEFNDHWINKSSLKLRNETRDRWLRQAFEDEDAVVDQQRKFKEFVTKELHLNYKIKILSGPSSKGLSTGDQDHQTKRKEGVETRKINNAKAKEVFVKICHICEGDHYAVNCTFLKDAKIMETLEKKRICSRCLQSPCKEGKKCGSYYSKRLSKFVSSDCRFGCKYNLKPIHFKLCGCGCAGKNEKAEENITAVKSNLVQKRLEVPGIGRGVCMTETVKIVHQGVLYNIRLFYDKGSDTTLVLKDIQHLGNLVGLKNIAVELADGSVKYGSQQPLLELRLHNETEKKEISIYALAVDKLSATKAFEVPIPEKWQKKYNLDEVVSGQAEEIQILLGMDNNEYMPIEVCREGGLSVYNSRVTGRDMVGGFSSEETQQSHRMHSARAKHTDLTSTIEMFQKAVGIENFDNPMSNKLLRDEFIEKKKAAEDRMIAENIKFDNVNKFYIVNLLHNDKLVALEENYGRVRKCQEGLGKKLAYKPEVRKQVNDQVNEYIEKNYWIKADHKILADVKVKKSFIPYNYIYNEGSESTPIRIIVNSSLKGSNKISLNDTYITGTSQIGDMKAMLLNMRVFQKLIMGDIKKFFTNFRLNDPEKYLHCLLVPVDSQGNIGYGVDTEFQVYIQDRLTFGDRPSPIVATLGRIKMGQEQGTSERIKRIFETSSYIDDIMAGVNYDEEVHTTIQELESVVSFAGMQFKEFIFSGMSTDDLDVPKNEAKALGYVWKVYEDELKLKLNFHIGKKDRGLNLEEGLNLNNFMDKTQTLTRRQALQITMSLYDCLGLFAPISLGLRLRMQQLIEKSKEWDEVLPAAEVSDFRGAVLEALLMKDVSLPRCITPKGYNPKKLPILVGFSDASQQAVGYVFYVRYELLDGTFEARILTAKARISGVRKLSVPRAELLAFQMMTQATEYLLTVLSLKFEKVINMTDSMIVIHQIQNSANEMDVYTGTRVDLIQSILQTYNIKVYHIPGAYNPADYCTRLCKAEDMKKDEWIKPNFLSQPIKDWPSKLFWEQDDIALKVTTVEETQPVDLSQIFNVQKYRSLKQVLKIIARILSWRYKDKSFQELMQMSLDMLEIYSSTESRYKHTQYRSFKHPDGRMYLINRGTESQSPKRIMYLEGTSFLGRLVLTSTHDLYHGYGTRFVGAKIRETYFVPQLNKRLKTIAKSCFRCKLLHRKELSQLMAPQKKIRTESCPPFTYIQIDFLGPKYTLDEVKKRTRMKIYFLLVSCLTTRAINVIPVRDLSTDSFIMGMRTHIAIRGGPKICYSDLGTNFKGAKRVLLDEDLQIDLTKIVDYAQNNSFEMRFGTPNHPEGQGSAEKSVHLFKLALMRNHSTTNFTYSEWVTIVAETSALVNSRPLILEPGPGEAITPNELLTLREVSAPLGPEVMDERLTRRSFLQREYVAAWFRRYKIGMTEKILGFNNKWKEKQENLKAGDLVLILDRPSVHLPFTYGIVQEAILSKDGLVRKVLLKYKDTNKKRWKSMERHVTSLSLLHSVHREENDLEGQGNQNGDSDYSLEDDPVQMVMVQYIADDAVPGILDLLKPKGTH